jgi:hypothetical protein
LLGAERMRSHFVVAVAMGPALRAGTRLLRNFLLRKRQRWATSNQTTVSPERYRCVLGFQTAHCASLASGLGPSFCCRSSPIASARSRGVAGLTDSELRRARRDVVRRGLGGFIAGWLGLERLCKCSCVGCAIVAPTPGVSLGLTLEGGRGVSWSDCLRQSPCRGCRARRDPHLSGSTLRRRPPARHRSCQCCRACKRWRK